VTTLSSLCDLIVDCEHRTAPTAASGYPLIRTPDVGVGRLHVETAQRVDEATYRAWTKRAEPQEGDLILAREAPVGNVGIVPPGVHPVLGQRTVLIRPRPDALDPYYLNYLLSGPKLRGWMESVSSGVTLPHLNMADIRSMELPLLPPLPTQRKVAAILSAYDALIENNNRRIKLLEEMAQRMYREWFVDFRYPGHENVPLVDSELGAIPRGWTVSTLGNVCARITDGAHHSPATTETGMPMASVKDMTPRSLELSTCRLISAEDYEALVRQDCRPRSGDVLVSKDGANFLKHVFPMFEDSVAVLLSSIAVLRPSNAISPVVLALTLRDPENKAQLKGFVSGVAIPRVVLKDFKLHRLVLPMRDTQERFEESSGAVMRQAVTLEYLNRRLRAARDLVLPHLISGEIDVTYLDIAMPDVAA